MFFSKSMAPSNKLNITSNIPNLNKIFIFLSSFQYIFLITNAYVVRELSSFQYLFSITNTYVVRVIFFLYKQSCL